MKVFNVSIGIIPTAKNPARIKATWTPRDADVMADKVIAEI